jgi:gamma-glutamyltranspeptidase/glutathione hydrolase
MPRDFHLPGRSPVIAAEGMAASSHPLASLTAIEVLKAGGNAADAAVAAVAVLSVVEPAMTGIGGDCFCLISRPDEPVWGYNGCGRAGAAASTEALLAKGIRDIAMTSIHAVTVPGAVEAWENILAARGRWGLDRVLQPAIRFAEGGFPVAARIAQDWSLTASKIAPDPGAAKYYLPGGKPPAEGDIVRLPALAATLRAIAAGGARAFYSGDIARDIVQTVAARGSFLTLEDFAAHRGEAVTPISTGYRGTDVLEIPPNGQGLTALVMLNILENFDLAALDPMGAERFHIVLEAARMAYAIRDAYIAEPSFMRVSVEGLLDKEFARKLASRIDRDKRSSLASVPPAESDTVYLTVVDRDRMAVSLINSLFAAFGVGICTEKTGVMLNNRGACFVVDPGHPNTFGGGKRPMHTIIPALAMRDGRCDLSFGVMGSHFQPMGHVQVMLNTLDYGMDIQQAIDMPRIFFDGERTLPERGMPAATLQGLRDRGHDVAIAPLPWGGGQAICIDWNRGVLVGGSDPRKDGCALGY